MDNTFVKYMQIAALRKRFQKVNRLGSLRIKLSNMHRKNSLHRNTSSMRIARAAQVRLNEISDKIERDKHKSNKSNYHEKVKIWNGSNRFIACLNHSTLSKKIKQDLQEVSLLFQNWTKKIARVKAMGCEKMDLCL